MKTKNMTTRHSKKTIGLCGSASFSSRFFSPPLGYRRKRERFAKKAA